VVDVAPTWATAHLSHFNPNFYVLDQLLKILILSLNGFDLAPTRMIGQGRRLMMTPMLFLVGAADVCVGWDDVHEAACIPTLFALGPVTHTRVDLFVYEG